jgi:O-antigen ligase
MHSSRFLSIDPNSTWRLILWKQVLVDHFPLNIIGIGFGTPMFKYFPIEDYSKLSTLPYVLGAHNSYVYLFGRLGLPYVLCMVGAYLYLFKEYFYHKAYYYANKQILLFWSFFAATVIALFNPALESPIYAGAYWLLLGFTARAIYNRNHPMINTPHEDSLHP